MPVIGTHAAVTDTCKGQVRTGHMLRTIIDGDTTGSCALTKRFNFTLILAKIIQRQRARFVIDKFNNLIERLIGFDRQHRTEDFILHNQ